MNQVRLSCNPDNYSGCCGPSVYTHKNNHAHIHIHILERQLKAMVDLRTKL